jgi:hypothetical protein
LLTGKLWQSVLLSAGLGLGVTALSPGVAEAQVVRPRPEPVPPVIRSTPATVRGSITQLSLNTRSDPGRAVRSFGPSTRAVTPSTVARTIATRPARTSRRGRLEAWAGMDNKAALAAARVGVVASGRSIATGSPAAPGAFNGLATAAPGPLPLLGAGVAFAYSRKVRRRVRQGTSGKFAPALAEA